MSIAGYGPLLDALRGVRWPARRPARGGSSGTHPSPLRGASPEFTEYRPYRQGDDPRRLDWKLLARSDRAYLRITSDRATLATLIVVDASASMAFPAPASSKWVQACRLAVGLMAVAHAAGDPVGLTVPGERGTVALDPRTRRDVLAEAARLLATVTPAGSASLAPALARARRAHRVVLVSDFLGDDGDALLRAARERTSAGGELLAVHVVAREEIEPPAGAVLAIDPERAALRRALVGDARAEYAATFARWRAELARTWRHTGAWFEEVLADEPAARAVRRLAGAAEAHGAEEDA